ncbi:hypothetical protein BDK51DRAFT_29519 [Blyttiomyces helicus]|uniref:Uncharacterized protein n=1 Tax=Blyttiomyces helicus TaxID=388810 RepID=A0A4V1IQ16_9FUNG|nr:hypothetical protein BDK51DRAFT_29519 [Blyttiomyces helicus]|eukprot:RKO84987.1 hypothetical protein BDK51DRAFT_29519 [Blyttiomyces helicus]
MIKEDGEAKDIRVRARAGVEAERSQEQAKDISLREKDGSGILDKDNAEPLHKRQKAGPRDFANTRARNLPQGLLHSREERAAQLFRDVDIMLVEGISAGWGEASQHTHCLEGQRTAEVDTGEAVLSPATKTCNRSDQHTTVLRVSASKTATVIRFHLRRGMELEHQREWEGNESEKRSSRGEC